jgi:hypothetical protein
MSIDGLEHGYLYDGKIFSSKADVEDYIRTPQIKEALGKMIEDEGSINWIVENRTDILDCFSVGTSRRVLKSERNQLQKALDEVIELDKVADTKKLSFIAENAGAIHESFKWPAQKKLSQEETAVVIKNSLNAIDKSDADLTDFIVENVDDIKEAFDAGKIKRKVDPKATAGLEAYRRKRAAEKKANGEDLTAYEKGLLGDEEVIDEAADTKEAS